MTTADKITQTARAEIGYHEGRDKNGNWTNHEKYAPQVPGLEWAQGQPWCGVFVAWVARRAGVADLYPPASVAASCDAAGAWWKKQGRWSAYPAIGAQVFFGSPSDLTHTGIVTRYDDTWVWSVEGNTNQNGSAQGDGVYENKRARRSDHVVGYGVPRFPDGIVSADPTYAGERPGSPKTVAPKETPYQRLARIAHQRLVKIRNLRAKLKRKR